MRAEQARSAAARLMSERQIRAAVRAREPGPLLRQSQGGYASTPGVVEASLGKGDVAGGDSDGHGVTRGRTMKDRTTLAWRAGLLAYVLAAFLSVAAGLVTA